eukprot:g1635.t1
MESKNKRQRVGFDLSSESNNREVIISGNPSPEKNHGTPRKKENGIGATFGSQWPQFIHYQNECNRKSKEKSEKDKRNYNRENASHEKDTKTEDDKESFEWNSSFDSYETTSTQELCPTTPLVNGIIVNVSEMKSKKLDIYKKDDSSLRAPKPKAAPLDALVTKTTRLDTLSDVCRIVDLSTMSTSSSSPSNSLPADSSTVVSSSSSPNGNVLEEDTMSPRRSKPLGPSSHITFKIPKSAEEALQWRETHKLRFNSGSSFIHSPLENEKYASNQKSLEKTLCPETGNSFWTVYDPRDKTFLGTFANIHIAHYVLARYVSLSKRKKKTKRRTGSQKLEQKIVQELEKRDEQELTQELQQELEKGYCIEPKKKGYPYFNDKTIAFPIPKTSKEAIEWRKKDGLVFKQSNRNLLGYVGIRKRETNSGTLFEIRVKDKYIFRNRNKFVALYVRAKYISLFDKINNKRKTKGKRKRVQLNAAGNGIFARAIADIGRDSSVIDECSTDTMKADAGHTSLSTMVDNTLSSTNASINAKDSTSTKDSAIAKDSSIAKDSAIAKDSDSTNARTSASAKDSTSATEPDGIYIGARVLARWKNRSKFYYAHVINIQRHSRRRTSYDVRYEDDNSIEKRLSRSRIHLVDNEDDDSTDETKDDDKTADNREKRGEERNSPPITASHVTSTHLETTEYSSGVSYARQQGNGKIPVETKQPIIETKEPTVETTNCYQSIHQSSEFKIRDNNNMNTMDNSKVKMNTLNTKDNKYSSNRTAFTSTKTTNQHGFLYQTPSFVHRPTTIAATYQGHTAATVHPFIDSKAQLQSFQQSRSGTFQQRRSGNFQQSRSGNFQQSRSETFQGISLQQRYPNQQRVEHLLRSPRKLNLSSRMKSILTKHTSPPTKLISSHRPRETIRERLLRLEYSLGISESQQNGGNSQNCNGVIQRVERMEQFLGLSRVQGDNTILRRHYRGLFGRFNEIEMCLYGSLSAQ